MPAPYPLELKERVMRVLDSGMRITNISKLFNISRDTIYKWKNSKEKTGSIQLKTNYQKGHSHKIQDLEKFKNFIEEYKDKTTQELAILWKDISPSTITKYMRKCGLTYKKKLFIIPKETKH